MTVVRTDLGDTREGARQMRFEQSSAVSARNVQKAIEEVGSNFVLGIAIAGEPLSEEIIEGHVFLNAVRFPAAFVGSLAVSRVAASGSSVISITKNNVQVGTITFGAGQSSGVYAMAAETTFAVGDRIDFVCPNPADANLSGIKLSLRGYR